MRVVTLEIGARGVVRIGLDAGSFFLFRTAYLSSPWDDPSFFESLRQGKGELEAFPGLLPALEGACASYAAEKIALSHLARREHSREELRKKLEKKGQGDQAIRAALDRLEAEKLLSEERYAEWYLRSRLRSRPEGERALEAGLRAKGLDREGAKRAVEAGREAIVASLEPYARKLLQREESKLEKKGLRGKEASLALRRALWSRLLSRGFSSPDIRSVLSRIAGGDRNLDEPDEST